MNHLQERELKLVPVDPFLLDRLAGLDALGELEARGRRHELQRNAFFDNASRGFRRERVGFRRRVIEGQRLAAWTLKADAAGPTGRAIATRFELELQLDADMPPALAVGLLRDAARSRGASALAEGVVDALRRGGLPLAQPMLELSTDRRILDLEAPARGWSVELALDRVTMLEHAYAELEIEAELKRGSLEALSAAHEGIAALGEVRPSHGSKLSRALAHLERCDCAARATQPTSAGPR